MTNRHGSERLRTDSSSAASSPDSPSFPQAPLLCGSCLYAGSTANTRNPYTLNTEHHPLHPHMEDTMNTDRNERTCRTCPGLGRDGVDGRPAPNYFDYRWACEECRPQLHGILKRTPSSFNDLDPTPSGTHTEHVSGTIEAPLGVRIAVLDQLYTGPALTAPTLPAGPDQDGVLPAARILWHIASAWLPAWREAHPAERLPEPTVRRLADWLDKRLDWACNTLEASISDHAAYLSALAHRLDRLNDPGSNKPEAIPYVPCRECDRYSLARQGDTVLCTAGDCKVRMGPDEYERWTKLSAEAAKQAA